MKRILFILIAASIGLSANFDVGKIPSPYVGGAIDLEKGLNNTLWVATWGDGVYRSDDNGDNFSRKSTDLGNLFVNEVKYKDGVLLAATYSGVYKSDDEGDSWEAINSGLDLQTPMTCIVIKDEDTYFVGSQGKGVYRTTDGGQNWEETNNGLDFRDIICLFVTSQNGYILASTKGDGVYRSVDNGDTWERENSGMYNDYITQIIEDPSGQIWASTAGDALFIANSEADSWSPYIIDELKDQNINSIAFFEENGSYYPVVATRKYGIWVFNSFADIWQPSAHFLNGVEDIISLTNDKFIYLNPSRGVFELDIAQEDISILGLSYNNVQSERARANENYLYVINDDGLFRSDNYGKTFESTDINEPVDILKVSGENVLAVTGDNENLLLSTDNGENFNPISLEIDDYPDIANHEKLPNLVSVDLEGNDISAYFRLDYGWNQASEPPMDYQPPASIQELFEATVQNPTIAKTTIDNIENEVSELEIATNGDIYISFERDSVYILENGATDFEKIEINLNGLSRIKQIEPVEGDGILIGSSDSLLFYNRQSDLFIGYDFPHPIILGVNILEDALTIRAIDKRTFYVGFDSPVGFYKTSNLGGNWDSLAQHFTVQEVSTLAANDDGDAYFGKTFLQYYINPDDLDSPELLSLEDNATNVATDINDSEGRVKAVFSWSEVPKADMYHLEISKSELFAGKVDDLVFKENSHTVTKQFEGSTVYYWRVRSRANDVYSDWSEVRTFTTELATPELVYPIEDQVGVALNASMTWNEVPLATSYDIQIAEDESLQNLVFDLEEITSSSITAQNLDNYTNYVWRARANSGDAKGKWSEFESFTTVPGHPSLIYPPDNSVGIPTEIEFRFSSSEGSQSNIIQVSSEESFSDPDKILLDRETDTDSSHFFDFLAFNRDYFWRMRSAITSNQETFSSSFSEVYSFKTGAEAPDLQLPTDESVDIDPDNVLLNWDDVSQADDYEVQVSLSPNFGEFIAEERSDDRAFELSGLDGYTVYYWRVRAYIDDFPGAWSEVWSFRTWIKSPLSTFPECGFSGINPEQVRLVWEKVNGGDLYEAQVSEISSFDSPIQTLDNINSDRVDVDGLETNRQYYWRVRGYNSESTGQWSEACDFTTASNSVGDLLVESSLSVYPNPAEDRFNLKIDAKINTNVTIRLISTDGKLSFEIFKGFIDKGSNLLGFETNNLPNGKYLIEITTDQGSKTKDLIIQK